MLLSKEAEVTLNPRNINRYKNLGYELPMKTKITYTKKGIKHESRPTIQMGATINVKIEDLSRGSIAPIMVMCDNCKKTYIKSYQEYLRYVDNDGKIYCSNCACTVKNSNINNIWYKADKTKEQRIADRSTKEYIEWSKKVLARDKYTCQYCNISKSKKLEAHHLDGYNWCVKRRFDVTNGICLCQECHCNFHNKYGRGDNTKAQIEEWFNNKELNLSLYNGEIPTSRWIYCIEDKIIIKDIDRLFGHQTACSIRKTCNGTTAWYKYKHYIYYNEYLQMSEEDVFKYVLDRLNPIPKIIICLNNKRVFVSISEAEKWCNHKINMQYIYNGIDPVTKEKLRWQYLSDYLTDKTLDEYIELFKQYGNNR